MKVLVLLAAVATLPALATAQTECDDVAAFRAEVMAQQSELVKQMLRYQELSKATLDAGEPLDREEVLVVMLSEHVIEAETAAKQYRCHALRAMQLLETAAHQLTTEGAN